MTMTYYDKGYDAFYAGTPRDCNETDAPDWFNGYDDAATNAAAGWHSFGSPASARRRLTALLRTSDNYD